MTPKGCVKQVDTSARPGMKVKNYKQEEKKHPNWIVVWQGGKFKIPSSKECQLEPKRYPFWDEHLLSQNISALVHYTTAQDGVDTT